MKRLALIVALFMLVNEHPAQENTPVEIDRENLSLSRCD